MVDNEKFGFTIYHNGAHWTTRVRGRKRFLRERAFLDDLIAPEFGRQPPVRPVPDPSTDFYALNDEQLDAYSTFRKKLREEEKDRGPE